MALVASETVKMPSSLSYMFVRRLHHYPLMMVAVCRESLAVAKLIASVAKMLESGSNWRPLLACRAQLEYIRPTTACFAALPSTFGCRLEEVTIWVPGLTYTVRKLCLLRVSIQYACQ